MKTKSHFSSVALFHKDQPWSLAWQPPLARLTAAALKGDRRFHFLTLFCFLAASFKVQGSQRCGDFNCFTFTRKPFRMRSRRTPGGVVFASFQLWTVVGGALATSATCLPPLPAVLSNPSPRTNGMDGKNWCYTTILLNGCPGIHTIKKIN